MFKIFKRKIVKKIKKKELGEPSELFKTGEIFKAKDKELENVLKKLTGGHLENQSDQKEIIRAITVLSIINNKRSENIQYTNMILSIFIIFLTIFSIYLAKQQTDYTEVSTRSDRIQQNMTIRNALEYCKQNPDSADSGLQQVNSGKYVTCEEVLKNQNLDKYKN